MTPDQLLTEAKQCVEQWDQDSAHERDTFLEPRAVRFARAILTDPDLREQLEQRRLERNSLVEYMNEQTAAITSHIATEKELRAKLAEVERELIEVKERAIECSEALSAKLAAVDEERATLRGALEKIVDAVNMSTLHSYFRMNQKIKDIARNALAHSRLAHTGGVSADSRTPNRRAAAGVKRE